MPDVPVRPKPEPEPTLAEKAEPVFAAIRTLLTGTPDGRVRRPLLFITVGLGIVVALIADGAVSVVFGGIAIIALLLLAWTDQVGLA